MSPLPVRVDSKARYLPSGEYSGRESCACEDTNSDASPPLNGTRQIPPPETNAISCRSGSIAGSPNDGLGGVCPGSNPATTINNTPRWNFMEGSYFQLFQILIPMDQSA